MPAITIQDLENAKADVDHIAEIATSLENTAVDRLGHSKQTMAGAVGSIAAINNRGAWMTGAAYLVKDLVSSAGTWYVCIVGHTASAAFATDSASKWRVYQGVIADDLASADPAKGASMVGIGNGRTQSDKNADWKTPYDAPFSAVGDGVADDSVALQTWAQSGKLLLWPAGKFRVSAANAIALNISEYNYGDASLKACVVFPGGVRVVTAGTATELIVDAPDSTTCGVAVTIDVSGTPVTGSQVITKIDRFKIRANGAHGRYGLVTPRNADIFHPKRPRYELSMYFAPPLGQDDKTISPYGWDVGMNVGDAQYGDLDISGYGTFNSLNNPAGQHGMIGMKISGDVGNVGMRMRSFTLSMYRVHEIGDSVEGFQLVDSEGANCYEGVKSTNSSDEPGGFVDRCHFSAAHRPYEFKLRSELHIGAVSAYRSDSVFDDGSPWYGIYLQDCTGFVEALHVAHGAVLSHTNSVGIYALRSSVNVPSYLITAVGNAFTLNACSDFTIGHGSINSVENLINLIGVSSDVVSAMPTIRGVHTRLQSFFTTDGASSKTRLYFPKETPYQIDRYLRLVPAATGSTTIKPRLSPNRVVITPSAGSGAYTYDIILDRASAVGGDEIEIKLNGYSSTNPTIRICDNSAAAVLSTFNAPGATKRIIGTYMFDAVLGTWVEYKTVDSVELTY